MLCISCSDMNMVSVQYRHYGSLVCHTICENVRQFEKLYNYIFYFNHNYKI